MKKAIGQLLKAKKAIVCFDLDGPILDVSGRYYELYCDLISELASEEIKPGLSLLSKRDYWNLKRRGTSEKEILRDSGVINAEFTDRYQRLRQERIEAKEYLRLDAPWPGVADALHSLKRKSALIVATLRSSRGRLLEQLGWLDLLTTFDEIISGQPGVERSSRADAKAHLISARYNLATMHSWFVGDTETDILAGKVLGCFTVGVSFGIRDESIIMAASPDLLLRTPVELIDWLSNLSV